MVTHIGPKRPFRLYIKEWVAHRGLTQAQVAERMGCEPGTLSKLISGKMNRTDNWLAAIAYALDIDVDELFRDPEAPTQEDLLRGLPDDKRDEVIKVIRVLTGTGG